MSAPHKTCPIITRPGAILAFRHPSAGFQFVKGTIEPGEPPAAAAARELQEESGLTCPLHPIGVQTIGGQPWHVFHGQAPDAPDHWTHQTTDDHGHVFAFFWHPLGAPLGPDWHPIFHAAYAFALPRIASVAAPPPIA